MFVGGDLTDRDVRQRIVATTLDTFGRLDILVNNAAVHNRGPVTEQDFDRVVALNYRAAFFLTEAAMPALITSGSGRVINVSTIGTIKSYAGGALYNSSKAALDSLTRSWASEHGHQGYG